MAKVDDSALTQIQDLFKQYEEELLLSNYSTNSKSQRVGYARRFVEWLGDRYSPDDYKG